MIVTVDQLKDANFINHQLLHRPLRAKIMAAIAVILVVGGVIAAVVANANGCNWSTACTIAPGAIAGASLVALVILRIWFHKIYCCTIKIAPVSQTDKQINEMINQTAIRHHDVAFKGEQLKQYLNLVFPNDASKILNLCAHTNRNDLLIYDTWKFQEYGSAGAKSTDYKYEVIKEKGEIFVKFDFTSTAVNAEAEIIGKARFYSLTNVRTDTSYIEFEFP